MAENYVGEKTLPILRQKLDAAISTKQDTLVSGKNIKTINGSSILGSGNLSISGDRPPLYDGFGTIGAPSVDTASSATWFDTSSRFDLDDSFALWLVFTISSSNLAKLTTDEAWIYWDFKYTNPRGISDGMTVPLHLHKDASASSVVILKSIYRIIFGSRNWQHRVRTNGSSKLNIAVECDYYMVKDGE